MERKYQNYWRNRSYMYWFWRLLQEVWELFWSLHGLHKDDPTWKLKQIASICINWYDRMIED